MGKTSSKKRTGSGGANLWLVFSLFLFALILYWNTLGHEFVFDDVTLIEQNQEVTRLNWSHLLGSRSYRPVRTLTYAINFWLGGLNPWGYHLVNIFLHAFNVVLVYLLLLKLSRRPWLATAAAGLFACHPVQTAAVAYVSGRKDLLATFFVLLALRLYLEWRRRGRWYHWLTVGACFLLAVLSKEVALTFPVLLLTTELVLRKRRSQEPLHVIIGPTLRRYRWILAGLAATAIAFFFYSIEVLEASRIEGYWGGSWMTNLGTSFKLFVHYSKLAIWPSPLIADYQGDVFSLSRGLTEPATLTAIVFMLGFLATTGLLLSGWPLVSFGLAWFWIALLPVLQLVPFHELAADHFLYLPMVGAAVLFGSLIDAAMQRPRHRWLTAAALLLVLAFASYRSVVRNRDWKDAESLWRATLAAAPGSFRANCNLGGILFEQRQLQQAIALTERCLELDPNQQLPFSNLSGLYKDAAIDLARAGKMPQALEMVQKAVDSARRAIELDPEVPWAKSNLGDAYKTQALMVESDQPDLTRQLRLQAIQEFKAAIELIPRGNETRAVVLFKLGTVFYDHGLYTQALGYFRQCIDQLKHLEQPQRLTGLAYLYTRRFEESLPHLRKALQLQPTALNFSYYAEALAGLGRVAEAISICQNGLRGFPDSVELNYQLAVLYVRIQRNDQARTHLQRALRAAPNHALAGQMRSLLDRLGRSGR